MDVSPAAFTGTRTALSERHFRRGFLSFDDGVLLFLAVVAGGAVRFVCRFFLPYTTVNPSSAVVQRGSGFFAISTYVGGVLVGAVVSWLRDGDFFREEGSCR